MRGLGSPFVRISATICSVGRYISQGDFLVLDCISKEIQSNIEMFGTCMHLIAVRDRDCRLIV